MPVTIWLYDALGIYRLQEDKYDLLSETGGFYCLLFQSLYLVGTLMVLSSSHFVLWFIIYLEDWFLFLYKCCTFIIYMAKYFFLLYIFKGLLEDAESDCALPKENSYHLTCKVRKKLCPKIKRSPHPNFWY